MKAISSGAFRGLAMLLQGPPERARADSGASTRKRGGIVRCGAAEDGRTFRRCADTIRVLRVGSKSFGVSFVRRRRLGAPGRLFPVTAPRRGLARRVAEWKREF